MEIDGPAISLDCQTEWVSSVFRRWITLQDTHWKFPLRDMRSSQARQPARRDRVQSNHVNKEADESCSSSRLCRSAGCRAATVTISLHLLLSRAKEGKTEPILMAIIFPPFLFDYFPRLGYRVDFWHHQHYYLYYYCATMNRANKDLTNTQSSGTAFFLLHQKINKMTFWLAETAASLGKSFWSSPFFLAVLEKTSLAKHIPNILSVCSVSRPGIP